MEKIILLSAFAKCFIAAARDVKINMYSSYLYLTMKHVEALAAVMSVHHIKRLFTI